MVRFLLTTMAVLGLSSATAFAQMPPTVVRAAPAEMNDVQLHRRVTGSMRAVARGDVAALEEGRVIEVTVREGGTVRRGDIIARVDARRLEAQKAELTASQRTVEAQIAQRAAELRQARLDLARHRTLVESRAITVEEYQHSETEVAVGEAQLLAERRRLVEVASQLQLLAVRLDDAVVRAPYDGKVVERHAEPGEWIRAGEPFVTLVSTGRIEAWLDVPERYLHDLIGSGTELRTDASAISIRIRGSDRDYPAISAKRVPDVHARTRTFSLVLTLDDAGGSLTPGMSVDAWVPMGPNEPRLTVPKDAVIRNGRDAYVYKAVEQQEQLTAAPSPVNVLFETGALAVVDAGTLSPGDRVIVEGNERLMPGAPIDVVEAEPLTEPVERQMADLRPNSAQRSSTP